MSATTDAESEENGRAEGTSRTETTVEVRATGHVRDALGTPRVEFTFAGDRLRDFLDAFFDRHPGLEDLLIAATEAEEATRGWAEAPEDLPGTWRRNPEGERTRAYARVCVNGTFNEHLDGFDTRLEDGDRVALIYPFIFCC